MAGVAHFWIDDGLDFFVSGVVSKRPSRGILVHTERRPKAPTGQKYYYADPTIVLECESTQLAETTIRLYTGARRAMIREIIEVFDQIEAPWAMVGPRSMSVMLPTIHSNEKWTLNYLRDWIGANCEGEVCLLSSTYKRRVSFSSDSDYILALMTFKGAGLIEPQ